MISEFITDHPFVAAPFFVAGFLSIVTYVFPVLLQNLLFDHWSINLKKKYKASWALVTGASSGRFSFFMNF